MQTLSKCVDDLWQTLLLGKPLPYQVWRKGMSGAGFFILRRGAGKRKAYLLGSGLSSSG